MSYGCPHCNTDFYLIYLSILSTATSPYPLPSHVPRQPREPVLVPIFPQLGQDGSQDPTTVGALTAHGLVGAEHEAQQVAPAVAGVVVAEAVVEVGGQEPLEGRQRGDAEGVVVGAQQLQVLEPAVAEDGLVERVRELAGARQLVVEAGLLHHGEQLASDLQEGVSRLIVASSPCQDGFDGFVDRGGLRVPEDRAVGSKRSSQFVEILDPILDPHLREEDVRRYIDIFEESPAVELVASSQGVSEEKVKRFDPDYSIEVGEHGAHPEDSLIRIIDDRNSVVLFQQLDKSGLAACK